MTHTISVYVSDLKKCYGKPLKNSIGNVIEYKSMEYMPLTDVFLAWIFHIHKTENKGSFGLIHLSDKVEKSCLCHNMGLSISVENNEFVYMFYPITEIKRMVQESNFPVCKECFAKMEELEKIGVQL